MDKKFQTIVIGAFIFFAVLGITLFAIYRGSGSVDPIKISIWGTYNEKIFNQVASEVGDNEEVPFDIEYKEFEEENFDEELVEALASGEGPDAVILSQNRILRHFKKIIPLPFSSFPESRFKENYLEVAEKLIVMDNIVALPFSIDPLVMYWNRDTFSNIGEVNGPKYWDEIYSITERIVRRDNSGNILKSAIALGEYDNINSSKEILSALIIQSGNPIISSRGERLESVLEKSYNQVLNPAQASLRFYTEFSNPSKDVYSWNRSFSSSRDEFLSGNLALYFGFSSELSGLRERNPNLNFDVTKIPQSKNSENEKTFANINSIAILKSSPKLNSAFQVAFRMTSPDAIKMFSELSNTPPISKYLISEKQEDSYKDVFYKSAVISSTWLDPDPVGSEEIYEDMIENVTSGKLRISQSVNRASKELQGLINKIKIF